MDVGQLIFFSNFGQCNLVILLVSVSTRNITANIHTLMVIIFLQKIRTIELDGKTIKLQIVSIVVAMCHCNAMQCH